MSKLAVVGSRTASPRSVADFLLHNYDHLSYEDTIVSGGAKGADKGGELFAEERQLNMNTHLPNWDKYGKAAGFIRNQYIVDDADLCIAFWDGKSKGTRHTINLFLDAGKPIRVIIV